MSRPILNNSKNNLKQLVKRLQLALENGLSESNSQVQLLKKRIVDLIRSLHGRLNGRELRRILGAAAIFFGLGMSQNSQAQNFDNPVADPFGIIKSSYVNLPSAVDIDGDGDLDIMAGSLVLSGYVPSAALEFHENTGTAQMPQFAPPVVDTFNIDLAGLNSYVVIPTFGDLDGDGDMDMMTGGSDKGLYYFENTGTDQAPSFAAPVLNAFFTNDSIYYGSPILLDLDDDGDLDLLSGEDDDRVVYFENTGSATSPVFDVKQFEPFGLMKSYNVFPTAGDVDWDGDLDIIIGDYYGDMHYYENTGSKTSPQFAAPVINPSNIVGSGFISFPSLADMDGDSDPDLLVGEGTYYTGVAFNFYENLATGISITELESGVEIFPTVVKTSVRIDSELEFSKMQLIGSDGAAVRSYDGEQRDLNMEDLPPAVYILELYTEDKGVLKRKLIKE